MATVAIFAVFSITAVDLLAQERQVDPEELKERAQEMRERLNLTDDQAEAIQPIMIDHLEKTDKVLKGYGIDLRTGERPEKRMGLRNARNMKSELDEVQASTEGELEKILDDDQMREYREIVQERQAARREKIKASRR